MQKEGLQKEGCFLVKGSFHNRLRPSSEKGPISNSFSTYLVEKFQRYRKLGWPIRVHLRVDARSESGADFFLHAN